jgi:Leucine Rich repeat
MDPIGSHWARHWARRNVENWPGELKAAPRIFQLTALTEWLAGKLRSLQGLTTLNLSGNTIGDEGARASPCLI